MGKARDKQTETQASTVSELNILNHGIK